MHVSNAIRIVARRTTHDERLIRGRHKMVMERRSKILKPGAPLRFFNDAEDPLRPSSLALDVTVSRHVRLYDRLRKERP